MNIELIAIIVTAILMIGAVIITNRKKSAGDGTREQLAGARNLLSSKEAELERQRDEIQKLNDFINSLSVEKGVLSKTIEAQQQEMDTRTREMQGWYDKMSAQFSEMASSLLESKEKGMDQKSEAVLKPLREALDSMKGELLQAKSDVANEIASLKDMSDQLGERTSHLANVFSGGNVVQGKWGESQLEKVLQVAGIPEGDMGYVMQTSAGNEQGGKDRPDCIINLPDNKCVIIDAKTNLTDYERSFGAASEAERDACLKAHANAVRNQIKNLGSKHYQSNAEYNSPDFVIMFVPVESALAAAQQYSDGDIYQLARQHNVTIATPWSLLSILFVIIHLWKVDQQNANVAKIAEQGQKVYEKTYQVVKQVDGLCKHLNLAQEDVQSLTKQLGDKNGGLLQQAVKLKELGVKPKSDSQGEHNIEGTTLYKQLMLPDEE